MARTTTLLVSILGLLSACGSPTGLPTSTAPVTVNVPAEPPRSEAVEPVPPAVEVGPTSAQRDSVEACRSDGDCMLSTASGCCSCCQCGELHATTITAESRARDRCGLVHCAPRDCAAEQCTPCASVPSTTHAVCRNGGCELAP